MVPGFFHFLKKKNFAILKKIFDSQNPNRWWWLNFLSKSLMMIDFLIKIAVYDWIFDPSFLLTDKRSVFSFVLPSFFDKNLAKFSKFDFFRFWSDSLFYFIWNDFQNLEIFLLKMVDSRYRDLKFQGSLACNEIIFWIDAFYILSHNLQPIISPGHLNSTNVRV